MPTPRCSPLKTAWWRFLTEFRHEEVRHLGSSETLKLLVSRRSLCSARAADSSRALRRPCSRAPRSPARNGARPLRPPRQHYRRPQPPAPSCAPNPASSASTWSSPTKKAITFTTSPRRISRLRQQSGTTLINFSYGTASTTTGAPERRYLVLFFDDSTMELADQVRARDAAQKFIDANVGPDRVWRWSISPAHCA